MLSGPHQKLHRFNHAPFTRTSSHVIHCLINLYLTRQVIMNIYASIHEQPRSILFTFGWVLKVKQIGPTFRSKLTITRLKWNAQPARCIWVSDQLCRGTVRKTNGKRRRRKRHMSLASKLQSICKGWRQQGRPKPWQWTLLSCVVILMNKPVENWSYKVLALAHFQNSIL